MSDIDAARKRLERDAAALAALPQNLDKRAGEELATDIRLLLAEVERLRKEVPTASQEVWRAEANKQVRRAEKAEAELAAERERVRIVCERGGVLSLETLPLRLKETEKAFAAERERAERREECACEHLLRRDAPEPTPSEQPKASHEFWFDYKTIYRGPETKCGGCGLPESDHRKGLS